MQKNMNDMVNLMDKHLHKNQSMGNIRRNIKISTNNENNNNSKNENIKIKYYR